MKSIKKFFLGVISIAGIFSLEAQGQRVASPIPGVGDVLPLSLLEEEEMDAAPASGTTTIPEVGNVRSFQFRAPNQAAGVVSQQIGGGAAATVLPFLPRGVQPIPAQAQQSRHPTIQTQEAPQIRTSQPQVRQQIQAQQAQARQQAQTPQTLPRQQVQAQLVQAQTKQQARQQVQVPQTQAMPQVRTGQGLRSLSSLRGYVESQIPAQKVVKTFGKSAVEESKVVQETLSPIPFVTASKPVQVVSSQPSQKVISAERISETKSTIPFVKESFREKKIQQHSTSVVQAPRVQKTAQQQRYEEEIEHNRVVEQQATQQRHEEERQRVETQQWQEREATQEQQRRQEAQAAQEAREAQRQRIIEEKRGFFLQEVRRLNELNNHIEKTREEARHWEQEGVNKSALIQRVDARLQQENVSKNQIEQQLQVLGREIRAQTARERVVQEQYAARRNGLNGGQQQALDNFISGRRGGDPVGPLTQAWQKHLELKAAALAKAQAQRSFDQLQRGEYADQLEKIRKVRELRQRLVDEYRMIDAEIRPADERAQEAKRLADEHLDQLRQEMSAQTPEVLRQIDPATSSKSLREAELYQLFPVFTALGIHGEVVDDGTFERRKNPHERWVADLKNKVDEKTRLDAVAPRNRTAEKEGNRNRIIAQLHDTVAFEALKRQVYGDADAQGLSYAQKGALIKAYLGATGRDPLKDQTWDELPYINGAIEPAGVTSFDEAVAQVRACHESEEEAGRRAAEAGEPADPDFDC